MKTTAARKYFVTKKDAAISVIRLSLRDPYR